jgi:hypothetical protein
MTDTTHAGSQITAIVVLTAAAILRGGAAAADPNQDDQFLALLDKRGIPALEGVPSLIDTAHKVCRNLDAGMPVDAMVDALVNYAYSVDPSERLYAPGRLARTEARFIIAAVEAYCPYDQGKIASVMANPVPGPHKPTHRVAANAHTAVNSGGDLREPPPALAMIDLSALCQKPTGTGAVGLPHLMDGGVSVAGRHGDDPSDCDAHGTVPASLIGASLEKVTPPNPPQIPPPPPPPAQRLTPPLPIAAPPPPKQPPPRPQQPRLPQQQLEPPAVGPQPGGAPGSGSTGGNGGPAEPSPAPPMPPGFVRLAP